MSSKKKPKLKSWLESLDFRKQSLTGKIILIVSVFIIGSFLIYVLLTVSMNRWDDLGIYSLWVLFGWFFFVILLYISIKLISLLMHKEKSAKQNSEQETSLESINSSKMNDNHDDQSKT